MTTHSAPMPRATGKALNAWLRGFAKRVRAPLSAAVVAGTLGGLLLVAQAWLLARVVDAVAIRGLGLEDCWPWLLDLLGVFAVRAVVSALTDAVAFEAGAKVALDVRAQVIDHIAALGPAFTRGARTGELATTAVDGIENLRRYYDGYLPQTALAATVPVAILVFVFPQDWISGTVMVLAAPLIPLFMVLIGKGAEALNRRQWRQLARMSAQFFDTIEGLTTLKLFDASRREVEVVAATAEDYRLRTMAVLRVAFLSSLMLEFFATVSIAMIAVYIGFRLYFGEMHFLPGFFVLLLAPEFFRPLRSMGVQYHARMEAIGSSEAIVALLATEAPATAWGDVELPAGPPLEVVFEAVSFGYGADAPVIHGVDFRIARGERVALIGPSGRRQDHARAAPARLRDAELGADRGRRHRSAHPVARGLDEAGRLASPAANAVPRHPARQSPARPARRHAKRDRPCAGLRRRGSLRSGVAEGARHPRRRPRAGPVGRRNPAHRARARFPRRR